ncbi:zinc finger protein Xfin-like isoform X2 [Pseudomyrmex gracilis]|uniref:zinc finger protein Xfin-like isoform X2 n=1 Tax=Pseudomyrmex gracilis TaxID=219809 RepID=UPI0009949063|nr:zinc finger protein Xfin-like isoform X2 [Pseudomyrmex gracilis]
MFSAASKGERRNLRGSARFSSKMSGRLSRLRALRPRSQQQRVRTAVIADATRKLEANLKEMTTSHEEENTVAKKCDLKRTEKGADIANTVSEMDDNDDDDELTMITTEKNEEAVRDDDIAINSEETTNFETSQQDSYECKSCKPSKTLPNMTAYLEHLQKEHKWNLERHMRNHGGGGAFKCRACNFTADIRQSLTVHESYHHDPPVGQVSRKSNKFERKPRNSPKRYNQVGASDFREVLNKTGNTTNSADSFIDHSLISIDDKKSALASAECIALKCEEQGCQFVTAWDSEMQRHLAESHTPPKPKKPLPSLIPLNIASSKPNTASSGPPSTLLKVPRVRVRPELAQIARNTELAKMYGNKQTTNSKRDLNNAADMFEKKNASFFDKLKEKLTTSSSINNGVPEVAVSSVNDLKCWCTFKASSMEELACHKQTHHTALSVSVGTTRCPKCRRRCKSTSDLQVHMQCCHLRNSSSSIDNSLDKVTNCSDICMTSYTGEHASPPQMDWDVNFRGPKSLESSVEGAPIHPGGRRVFKCPHCPFWASTASRFHVHIVGHLNRKPFECSMCAYRSNWRWDITKHIKLKAAKDAVHMTARVLMTDETGRRNYSKYNKYLAQVEQQSWDEDHMEERSTREINSDEPPTKVVIVDKEYSSTVGHSQSSVTILPSNEANQNSRNVNVSLRPPPPLKAAVKSRGQSLLRNNPITMLTVNDNGPIATATDENKRTQWKCKRCNYRDCNKENVLLHVKSHYESTDQQFTEEKNPFGCSDCPFSASDAATLSLHRIHHRPNLEAIFKCYLCPYYVSTKAELLDHVRLHGEELAAIHKQNIDFELSSKCKQQQVSISDGGVDCSKDETTFMEQMIQITSRNNVTLASKNAGVPPPPPSLLLDTRALPDVPMVWVSRPDGTLSKMLKCRHCPYVSSRRAEVREHETMHVDTPTQTPSIACTDCSFTCWHRDIMIAHTEMHAGSLGTVHCLVDETRPDAQQASDLATLLGMTHTPTLGTEPDLEEFRLVHCCGKCPARFLCEKELRIHLRYHSTELAYSCQWCTYAARQATHLQAHQKAHSTEYQERTKYLLSVYGFSQRYPPPATACVEAETQESNDGTSNVAWIVVEMNDNANNSYGSAITSSLPSVQRTGNSQQVFTCAKCPARYFKLDALEYHMTLHGSNNRFKCNDCDYSSKTAQNLVKHQVVHRRHNETSEVTTSSSVTNVSSSASVSVASSLHSSPDPQFGIFMRGNPNFVYPGYLRNGRLKEKRYKCHKCPSAFEKREQYRVHLTLHGAKQRYRCNMCDYSVKYYANYIQHVKKHQANAQAQASRRQFEDDRISIDSDSIADIAMSSSRSSKSLRSSAVSINGIVTSSSGNNNAFGVANNNAVLQSSNQDKQTLLLMQKKGVISLTGDADVNTIRCQSCPFFTTDKDTMDMHKRRHGIDRMTPPCPYCDYIPRKDENVNEHIQLHFTRLYKPESYLIVELLTLTIEKVSINSKEDKNDSQRIKEVLFKECADGRFLPLAEPNSLSLGTSSIVNTLKEKITVDPNTGETKHHLV